MATLFNATVASTYTYLLKMADTGIDGTLRKVQDGNADNSALSLSLTAMAIDATDRLYLDGGDNTYIAETSSDTIGFIASDSTKMTIGGSLLEPYGTAYAAKLYGALMIGDESSTGGDLLFSGYYSGDGSLVNFGSEYSSGAPEIGFACQPSTSVRNEHISTSNNTQYKSALNVSRWLHYRHSNGYSGTSSIAAGSAVELGTVFSIAENGFMGLTLPAHQPDRTTIIEYDGDSADAQLTIQQGSYDGNVLSFKSTDVAHGLTSIAETDTYAEFAKGDGATGGLRITALADGSALSPLRFDAFGTTMNTVQGTGYMGMIDFLAKLHDNAGNEVDLTANGNVLAVGGRVGGVTRRLFIIDASGDLHCDAGGGAVADGGSSTNANIFDSYNDAQLVRALDMNMPNTQGLIENQWDKYIDYNEQTLIDAGILGDKLEEGGMTNITRLQRLHNGAIWQQYEQFQNLLQAFEKVSTEVIGDKATKELLENNNIKMLGKS